MPAVEPGRHFSLRGGQDFGEDHTCGMPGKIELRNGATGASLGVLDTGTPNPRPWFGQPLAFTPDGKKFIATDGDTNVFVWDVATGKELHKFAGHRG
jgi:WD40 repeat protein